MHSRGSWYDRMAPPKLLRLLLLHASTPVFCGVLQVRPSTQVVSVSGQPWRRLALWYGESGT